MSMCLRSCYALPGTDLRERCYAPTRAIRDVRSIPQLFIVARSAIILCACCALSGTDLKFWAMSLCACYAMSGTHVVVRTSYTEARLGTSYVLKLLLNSWAALVFIVSCRQPLETTPRNQRQETAISVQIVPGMRFLAFDFGVDYRICENHIVATTPSVPRRVFAMLGPDISRVAGYRMELGDLHFRLLVHPEFQHKKPQFQYNSYQECGFLYLISGLLATRSAYMLAQY
eukprot:2183118-Rhodomonas_salina.4